MSSAVAAIVKNEARAIAEWLAFQRVIGFDSILVYDNGSTDATPQIVADIARLEPAITYTPWPDQAGQNPQVSAYRHAVRTSEADWIAFLDVDEFLLPRRHGDVNRYLASMPADISALAINWRIFGSAGRRFSGDNLVIERFIRCAFRGHAKNRFCKTIARRDHIADPGVHTCGLAEGQYGDSLGRPIRLASDAKTIRVVHAGAQINHYLLKSWQEFEEKRRRGNASRPPEAPDKYTHRGAITAPSGAFARKTDANEYWITHNLNHTFDTHILVYRDRVMDRLSLWGFAPRTGSPADTTLIETLVLSLSGRPRRTPR